MNDKNKIATFRNARTAILADVACKEMSLKVAVIPTPTNISSECGMSLRVDLESLDEFVLLMQNKNIECKIYDKI